MTSRYDLHTHSTASDGTLSPEQLVWRAAEKGVTTLALTDHDTLEGLAQAQTAAQAAGLTLCPGVEVSVTWGGRTIHILGLGVDLRCEPLLRGLARLVKQRQWRAGEIARRLGEIGIDGAFEGAKAYSNGQLIGRTHFARFLARKGLAASERDVFKHYLVKGKPGHVSGDWASLEEAVGWIRAAGGKAAIAHPARYGFRRAKMLKLIGQFKEAGGVAIEAISGSHSRDENLTFAQLAREQKLLCSVGSDFHDPVNPWVELGGLPSLPPYCMPIWAHWEEQGLRDASSSG